MSIYKTCDIRGVYGQDLDDALAYRLGRAVATLYPVMDVVVGGDLRLSTPPLKGALIRGLVDSGADVIDVGALPTPALYWAKRTLGTAGALMVTASHNPARYNGLKLMMGNLPVTPDDLQALSSVVEAGGFREGRGSVRCEGIVGPYSDALVARFGSLAPRRVVVDAGSGSMSEVAPDVLRRCGLEVSPLYCEPDGAFPYRDPNPSVPEHLTDLQAKVLSQGAELGVAYDGDGDRVIFVDGLGCVQPADRTAVLFVRHLLSGTQGDGVVYDLKSSSVVADETLLLGGSPLMERSGHAFIKRRLLIEDAVLGTEASGHYFFRSQGGDDALYATLLLLEILDALGQTYTQAIDTVPQYPITPDLRLPCAPEKALAIIAELKEAFPDLPQSTLDGVRIQFPHGWALARMSVTEPLITLRFEAQTEGALEEIVRRVREASGELDGLMATG